MTLRIAPLTLSIQLIAMIIGLASCHADSARQPAQIQKSDTLPASTPWNLETLSKAPECEWADGKEARPLYYQGELFEGKPTRVFAYYATPGSLAGDPTLDKNLPGIVLVHGGGGRAFDGWAKLWASRGYAAIAMDLSGRGIEGKPMADGGPNQSDKVKFADQPSTDMWTYHAVANVIRAHSLLLSLPEVDPERTALTGISWGGYLTCIVAGLDNRFKAAAPVYGCGFLHENSVWLKQFSAMEEQQCKRWIQLWDPSNYVGSAQMPMLFANGGKDFAYPPDSHAKTYALVKSPKELHFVPDLRHGHVFDKPKAIEVFIDSNLKGGKPLPTIGPVVVEEMNLIASPSGPTRLIDAQLHHTADPVSANPSQRKWISQPATLDDHGLKTPMPPIGTTIWFLTVTDERGVTVSSPLVFPAAAQK